MIHLKKSLAQLLSLTNWMIAYLIVATWLYIFFEIDPTIEIKFINIDSRPWWVQLVHVIMLAIPMIPIWLKINKWMNVKFK